MAKFEYRQAEEIRDAFAQHGVRYLFLGKSSELERGKDFVQLKNGPFDIDLIFAPDGIERFDDAWQRRIMVEGFPVCHIDDIIASKEATGRQKDQETLPRLKAFREYLLQK
jgi:hypothetical protein